MVNPRRTGNNGFTIEVGCPGCGADLFLEKDFRLLQCAHCGSVLRIVMPDLPPAYFVRPKKSPQEIRFLLERHCRENEVPMPASSSPLSLIYYPYWRIDAVTLKVRHSVYEVQRAQEEEYDDGSVEEKEVTTVNLSPYSSTVPATQRSDAIPYSLGVRSGYLALAPFMREKIDADVRCFAVNEPFPSAVERAVRATVGLGRYDQADGRQNSTVLFHPQGSIIFFCYYLLESYSPEGARRYAIDAVTGRVAGTELLAETPITEEEKPSVTFGTLGVEFHRCTNCGIDLPVGRSYVYACHNCGRIEFLDVHPTLQKEILVSSGKVNQSATYFPFWMIQAESDGGRSDHQFVVPAFEMRNAETMYRLSSRISTAIHKIPVEPMRDLVRQEVPVSRSIEDSLALLEVLYYRRAAERDGMSRKTFTPCNPTLIRLVFLPFRPAQYFFVDTVLEAVTFERAGATTPTHS